MLKTTPNSLVYMYEENTTRNPQLELSDHKEFHSEVS